MIDFEAILMIRKYGDILTEQQIHILEKKVFANASETELKKLEAVVEMFEKIKEIDKKEEK